MSPEHINFYNGQLKYNNKQFWHWLTSHAGKHNLLWSTAKIQMLRPIHASSISTYSINFICTCPIDQLTCWLSSPVLPYVLLSTMYWSRWCLQHIHCKAICSLTCIHTRSVVCKQFILYLQEYMYMFVTQLFCVWHVKGPQVALINCMCSHNTLYISV